MIVRNVLSREEIKTLWRLLKKHFAAKGVPANWGLTQSNAVVEVLGLGWLLHHDNVLAVMRHLLGRDDIMFTSHCDLHWRTLSGWHKYDGMTVVDGGYLGAPMYERDDCRVYKVAFYLQDHTPLKGGGLTVRKGSHRFASLQQGEKVHLASRAGDAIIFDVRLSHIGQADVVFNALMQRPIRLGRKIGHRLLGLSHKRMHTLLKSVVDRTTRGRGSIFFTYGNADKYTKTFVIRNMERQMRQTTKANTRLSVSSRQVFIENGVAIAEDYFVDHFGRSLLPVAAS